MISRDANYGPHRPRTRIKNLEPCQKIAYHTRTAPFFCVVFGYTSRIGAALAFHTLRGAREGVVRFVKLRRSRSSLNRLPATTSKACVVSEVGPKKGITLDQTGYGAIQRVTQGPLNRALPAPYYPGSALSVENHYFGPWVCRSVLGTRVSPARDTHRPVWPGFHPS